MVQNVSVINVQDMKTSHNEETDQLSTLHSTSGVLDGIHDNQDKHLVCCYSTL